jgi:hypothetical protein
MTNASMSTSIDHPTPPARHDAPATSHAAARAIAPRAPSQRDQVLYAIRQAGARGLTDDEGESALGIRPQSYTPRRGELAREGLIVDSGRRRRTSGGREAIVWIAREHAAFIGLFAGLFAGCGG